ncbi:MULTISPECIES: phage tail protein [Leptolyngbya]|uniref:phage tail protein n=1 Tax=Leptolyngbya TaxID=47251 RepID=UPI00168913C5|nr:tail fiber protein [Leptolyngbya sp. FACHB-1624]MBD1857656.1 tail fiber protein [Leptolyngbya sp. FACHB-1624]
MAKFQGNIANLRLYDRALSLEEIRRDAQADETITVKFLAANPIEFNLYNQQDEQAIYITEDSKPHPFTLELINASPRDITFQTPAAEDLTIDKTWAEWVASASLYHFQLRFRPGTLSEAAKQWFKKPAIRLIALAQGWDIKYDPEDKDPEDWISLLWIGLTQGENLVTEIFQPIQPKPPGAASSPQPIQPKQIGAVTSPLKAIYRDFNDTIVQGYEQKLRDIQAEVDRIKNDPNLKLIFQKLKKEGQITTFTLLKNTVYKILIPHLSAGAEGGARGTRIYLNYKHLLYEDKERIPDGGRSQFINIINHQGKEYIPLHVGFVGSNKIVNDGLVSNELTLRVTNISRSQSIQFQKISESQASKFTISFDVGNNAWALAQESQRSAISVSIGSTDQTLALGKSENWERTSNDQGEQSRWSFAYKGSNPAILNAGASIKFKLTGIKSSSPSGLTNLSLNYEDIPGYWDGRFVCSIEKTPLVYRTVEKRELVGIGTDTPNAKLHIKNDSTKQAALFDGGDVEISAGKLVVKGIGTSTFTGDVSTTGNLDVSGRIREKTGLIMPVGSILPFAGAITPVGWLLCDGTLYDTNQRKDLVDLFQVIGISYRSTSGENLQIGSFRVPDLRGRFLVGVGSANPAYSLGATGGQNSVQLTVDQLASHNHSGSVTINHRDLSHRHSMQFSHDDLSLLGDRRHYSVLRKTLDTNQPGRQTHYTDHESTGHSHDGSISINSVGSNQAHENRPPYLAINYIIKY